MSSERLPYRAINPARIRMQPDLKTRIEDAAEAMHRSMNSEIVARLEASFEEKPAAAPPPSADYSDEVSNADLAALNAIGERAMTGEGFSLVAGPAWPTGREPGAGLDVDRLDRLTTIVDRTRLALGTNAARELWPMLGLPLLRTSSRRSSPKEEGPDLLSALDAPAEIRATRSVKEWVAQFLQEQCEMDAEEEVSAGAFREAYTAWAKRRQAPIPPGHSLGRYAVSLGVRRRKSGRSLYLGMRLKCSAP